MPIPARDSFKTKRNIMKKVLALLAIAGMMAACGNNAEKKKDGMDAKMEEKMDGKMEEKMDGKMEDKMEEKMNDKMGDTSKMKMEEAKPKM